MTEMRGVYKQLEAINFNLKRIADILEKEDRKKKLESYLGGGCYVGQHDPAQPEDLQSR